MSLRLCRTLVLAALLVVHVSALCTDPSGCLFDDEDPSPLLTAGGEEEPAVAVPLTRTRRLIAAIDPSGSPVVDSAPTQGGEPVDFPARVAWRGAFERAGATTDKITHHGYHRFFADELHALRDQTFGMIEIGIQHGPSLTLWQEYFPRAHIYGLDDKVAIDEPRVTVVRGDQIVLGDLKRLQAALDPALPIRFINDDGAHHPDHQFKTFDYLFRHVLAEGGVYIVEDIETSYWRRVTNWDTGDQFPYPYGLLRGESFIQRAKALIDLINHEYLSPGDRVKVEAKTEFLSRDTKMAISSVRFGHNCVVFRKKTRDEAAYQNRKYRYAPNTDDYV